MFEIHGKPNCSGFTLLECVVALVLIATGMTITAQVLAVYAHNRNVGDHFLAAQWEAANAQEKIAAMPYGDVTQQGVEQIKLSPEAQSALPDAKLQISVVDQTGTTPHAVNAADNAATPRLPSKRVRVEVSWTNAEGPAQSEVLTSWKFPRHGGSQP